MLLLTEGFDVNNLNFKKQSGVTFVGMLFIAAFSISVFIFGGQIGFAYIKKFEIKNNIDIVLDEVKSSDQKSVVDVRRALMKRLNINSIDIPRDEIDIKSISNGFIVSINHFEEIKVTDNISILVDISVEVEK